MSSRPSESYRSWLIGELVLVLLLGIGTILFVTSGRLDGYAVTNARISLDTAAFLQVIERPYDWDLADAHQG